MKIERKLIEFVKVVNALKRTKFIKNTYEIGVRSAEGKYKKIRLRQFGYDEEELKSALMDFRKIILQGEITNFYTICNDVERSKLSQALKNKTRSIRKEFTDVLNKDVTLYDGKTHDKPRDVLDKWLNGKYFHQEPIKHRALERMNFVRQVHKLVFVATVLDLTRIAIKLAYVFNLKR